MTISKCNSPGQQAQIMKPIQLATYLFLAVTWGFSFVVLLRLVEAFGWAGAVALRGLMAGFILLLAARLGRRQLDFSIGWRHLAIVGATTVAGQLTFLSIATPLIGTAMSAIFVAAIPLFSMVISQIWGLEQISKQGFFGIILGMAGIFMLVGFPAVPMTREFLFGCSCSMLAAFFAAYGSNYVSAHLRAVGSWEVTIGSFITGGLMTLPLMWFVPIPVAVTPASIGWLILNAGIVSALNYILYFRLVAQIGATKTISVEFMVTVVAVIVGTLLLGEHLSAAQFVGAAIIVSGCTLVLGLIPSKAKAQIHPA
jgi:drug/metabolite transporter (DMT)-like permease